MLNASNWKRYFWSTMVTFLTGFGLVLVSNIDSLSLESFKDGSYVGVIFACARAGIKAVVEGFLSWRRRKAVLMTDKGE